MSHILLTGATGLLGRYLIRDLIQQGHSLAVLVRSSRQASATERIDEVMKHWEPETGVLPAPGTTLHQGFDGPQTEVGNVNTDAGNESAVGIGPHHEQQGCQPQQTQSS